MKVKIKIIMFLFISFIKSIKIFNNTSVSDFLLPGKIDIIFLFLGIIFSIIFLLSSLFSINGCPTKVFLYFLHQNIFFQSQIIKEYDQ